MTLREVNWRIKRITDRNKLDLKVNAMLHDKEIKEKDTTEIKVTKEQESAMEKAIEAAKLRKAKQYGK